MNFRMHGSSPFRFLIFIQVMLQQQQKKGEAENTGLLLCSTHLRSHNYRLASANMTVASFHATDKTLATLGTYL